MKSVVTVSIIICSFLLSTTHQSFPSTQQKRIALVIGNGAYKTGPLKNPTNDANDMATALRKLGFDVIERINADKRAMMLAVDEFYTKLRRSEVGLFYFAGHGIQIQGVNYLIPVKSHVTSQTDIQFEAMDAGRVLGKMKSAGNKLNIVILDACRNNPFKRSFRTENLGLAQMDAPKGTVIAYATSPGSVAADGAGRNGIYTSHLLDNLKKPELSLQEMFMETGLGVMHVTGDRQIPWISSTPIPRYYLVGRAASFESEIQEKKKRIADLEKMDKAAAEELRRQQDEIAVKQAQLEKLDNKLAKLQVKLGAENAKSDLGAMLAMLEEKERKAKELEELRKKAEQELLAKESAIAKAERLQDEQRRSRFESDYEKYKKIEASKYALEEFKNQAWRLLCETWGVSEHNSRDKVLRYQKGQVVALRIKAQDGRFEAYANGLVYDKDTGLEWYAGPDKGTTCHEAKSWVASLNVYDGGWRLPKFEETSTLYKKGAGTRNMTPLLETTGWSVLYEEELSSPGVFAAFDFGRGDRILFDAIFDPEIRAFAVRSRR